MKQRILRKSTRGWVPVDPRGRGQRSPRWEMARWNRKDALSVLLKEYSSWPDLKKAGWRIERCCLVSERGDR